MTDEIENEVVANPEDVDGTVETQESKNSPKAFTQEQVNKMVQERVKREKLAAKKLSEDFESEKGQYLEQISKYEDILSKTVEKQLADYPDYVKSLVSKLSLLDQVEWLADEKNKISRREFPQRKQAEEKQEDTSPKKKLNVGI